MTTRPRFRLLFATIAALLSGVLIGGLGTYRALRDSGGHLTLAGIKSVGCMARYHPQFGSLDWQIRTSDFRSTFACGEVRSLPGLVIECACYNDTAGSSQQFQ